MIEPVAAGASGAGADFRRGAPASGRLRTAPPHSARPVRLSGVPSRWPSGGLFEPVGVEEAAEQRGADDLRSLWSAKNESGGFGRLDDGPKWGFWEC